MPDVHPSTLRLHDSLAGGLTHGDEATGWLLLRFLDGIGAELGVIDDIIRDSETAPGWARELDPDTTTRPGWLAQFVGSRVPSGASLTEAREVVRARPTLRRGSPGALVDAVARTLTGTRRVDLFERTPDVDHITVRTYAGETPDAAATERAARSQKPVRRILVMEVFPGLPYDERDALYATYDQMDAAFPTYDQLDRGGL
jgi:hypothetical protein